MGLVLLTPGILESITAHQIYLHVSMTEDRKGSMEVTALPRYIGMAGPFSMPQAAFEFIISISTPDLDIISQDAQHKSRLAECPGHWCGRTGIRRLCYYSLALG